MAAVLTPELVEYKLDVLLAFCRRFRELTHLVVARTDPHAGRRANSA